MLRALLCAALACGVWGAGSAKQEHTHGDHVERLQHHTVTAPPDLQRAIWNIGSHDTPPVPFDNITAVIAVEPLAEVAAKIPHVPNRFVLTAAVADYAGMAFLNHYTDSSSLLPALEDATRVTGKGLKGAKLLVPVLPLSYVLSVFPGLDCWLLKTDMQGLDFVTVRTAPREVQRCQWVLTEVYCNGYNSYAGAQNDLRRDWEPFMSALGFELAGGDPCTDAEGRPIHDELNALWVNKRRTDVVPITREQCQDCYI